MTIKFSLINNSNLPLVISSEGRDFNIISWVRENRELVRKYFNDHGAILFRGFPIHTIEDFESLMESATSNQWMSYNESSSPRSKIASHTSTSTEYASDQTIFPHNENSHTGCWPGYLAFWCKKAPLSGGETSLVDCRTLFHKIPQEIKENFFERGLLYVRRFSNNMGIPWRKAFGLDTREELEAYCRENHIEDVEWASDDTPILRYKRKVAVKHPITDDMCWFNHGMIFNAHGLDPKLKASFLSSFDKSELPYNTYYGDGTEIEIETVEKIQSVYWENMVANPYQNGDVIIVDNMLVAHGRNPFAGIRRVLVAMTNPVDYCSVERY